MTPCVQIAKLIMCGCLLKVLLLCSELFKKFSFSTMVRLEIKLYNITPSFAGRSESQQWH